MTELKKCPACGASADAERCSYSGDLFVECDSCTFRTLVHYTIEDATEAWNHRPAEDILTAALQSVRDEVERMKCEAKQADKAFESLDRIRQKQVGSARDALRHSRAELREMCTRVLEIAEKDELHILLQKVSGAESKARAILSHIGECDV